LVAHRKIETEKLGIDYLAFSGHKTYAPFGSGVLLVRKSLLPSNRSEIDEIGQQGERNLAGVITLAKALSVLNQIGMDTIRQEEIKLTNYAYEKMQSLQQLSIYGPVEIDHEADESRVGVLSFSHPKIMGFKFAKQLAIQSGIGIRYGCHCAHMIVKHILGVGPGLERFQKFMATVIPRINFPGVARVSIGLENTTADIDRLVKTLEAILHPQESPNKSSNQVIKSFIKERTLQVYRDTTFNT